MKPGKNLACFCLLFLGLTPAQNLAKCRRWFCVLQQLNKEALRFWLFRPSPISIKQKMYRVKLKDSAIDILDCLFGSLMFTFLSNQFPRLTMLENCMHILS